MFTVFCSSFSLAGTSKKITPEDVDRIFIKNQENIANRSYNYKLKKPDTAETERIKTSIERQKNRRAAKCLYFFVNWNDKSCSAKIIRVMLKKSEINKKRKPGDVFYVLDAITFFLPNSRKGNNPLDLKPNIMIYGAFDEPQPGMTCFKIRNYHKMGCHKYKESFKKKFEKFKKDPSKEKVLGQNVLKYIKNIKIVDSVYETIGENDLKTYSQYGLEELWNLYLLQKKGSAMRTTNYSLIGDMLNELVEDVKKNNISSEEKIRRALLKKYSLKLTNIKEKLDKNNFKSIDKDVPKLSKIYNDLKALKKTTNKITINIDEAVNVLFDTNELVLRSSLNSKDDEGEKLLSLASINFMQSLINSIIKTLPEKYIVKTKKLENHLFNEYDLEKLEFLINTMSVKNKETKLAEFTESINKINKYINTSDVLKKLGNIGIKNITDRKLTIASAVDVAELQIREGLGSEILKDANKILQNIDSDSLSEITQEISEVASEVSSDPSIKETTYNSVLDRKFGGITLKQLIAVSRQGQ